MSKTTKKAPATGTKKPHRFRPGTVALRQIRKQQKSTELSFPHQPFVRKVKKMIDDRVDNFKLGSDAAKMLQIAMEEYLVKIYRDANLVSIHAGRQSVRGADIDLVQQIEK